MEKLKSIFSNKSTWKTLLYMLIQMPLGVIYLIVFVTFGALGLSFIATPLLQKIWDIPLMVWGNSTVYFGNELLPLVFLLGVIIVTVLLHLAKFLGDKHGNYAKKMLVG